MSINYNKNISRLIVIGSLLQQLRTEPIESGRVLQGLLKKPFPSANAVLAAVEKIHNLLEHDDICDVWVSARVKGRRRVQIHHEPSSSCGEYGIHFVLRLYVIFSCLINLVVLR